MKSYFWRRAATVAGIILLAALIFGSFQFRAQALQGGQALPNNGGQAISGDITPQAVLNAMQRVADWQLAHLSDNTRGPTDWVASVGDAGLMALEGISGDAKYRTAMLGIAEANHWQLGPRTYMADDQAVGQTYAELYFLYRDPKMIAPMREQFDAVLAKPPATASLDFSQPGHGQDLWSWCDALFMAPSTWARLYAATGDERYLDFAVKNWWRTTDYLYDKDEHLFYRDSTYFKKREANARKVFWSRGNGWVMAGLVRTLQYMPMNYPERPRFEQMFKEMADKILSSQQADGLWRASLLDPASYPAKETSGSGLFIYALAWGVNQGLLDGEKFGPAVEKGWAALAGCVDTDGKLTHVQPIGADPKNFDENSTEPYGVGAFLLAGSEVYRMAALTPIQHGEFLLFTHSDSGTKLYGFHEGFAVKVSNPSSFRRESETVEISGRMIVENLSLSLTELMGPDSDAITTKLFQSNPLAVMDGVSSRILDSQIYSSEPNTTPDKLLFQVDLAPGEARTFYVLSTSLLAAVPPAIVKTFARYVPERHDDFAWESDRIAHRLFGKALETWKEEPLTGSGVDVWVKRARDLILNQTYASGKYYDVNAESQDDYRTHDFRGCGGLGIWDGQTLHVSANWRTWTLITTGPIRSEFELTYDAWDAGKGRMVSETKRISIDAGSNLSRVESTFSSEDKAPLEIGVGLTERPGENVIVADGSRHVDAWQSSTAKGLVVQNRSEGWMAYWQPQDFDKGTIGTAIILPKGSVETFTNDNPNLPASAFAAPTHTFTEGQPAIRDLLAVTRAEVGKPLVYYLGAGWSESGDFPDAKTWVDTVRRFAERRDQPLQVTTGN
ncbi:MAG: glycoside hydrolase family 88 protein [Candidatus Acidiferrales bacterium]